MDLTITPKLKFRKVEDHKKSYKVILETGKEIYLPKSQVRFICDKLFCPEWLAISKNIWEYLTWK